MIVDDQAVEDIMYPIATLSKDVPKKSKRPKPYNEKVLGPGPVYGSNKARVVFRDTYGKSYYRDKNGCIRRNEN